VQLKLGKNYLAAKDLTGAIDCLKAVTKNDVNQPEGWETLAEAYYQTGQTAEALQAAQRAMDVNAFSVKPYLLSARINLDQGKTVIALEQAQKALKQDEKNPETMVILAKAWLASGNKLQALHALEKVPQAKNVSVAQLIEHARLVKDINGTANAKGMLESLAERYPDNLDVLNMLAEAQLANGDKVGAEKSAQRSLKLQENQPQTQRFLGKLEFESGHLDQAIYHYSQAVAIDPESQDAYLELSKVYEQQRDYSAAVDTLNKALELQPENLPAVLAAANLMRNAKDYSKAEAFLRRAAEIAPNDLNVRRQLGAVIALNLVESSQEASSHI
jgi:tetratricopeptide (TPR) repeat protein